MNLSPVEIARKNLEYVPKHLGDLYISLIAKTYFVRGLYSRGRLANAFGNLCARAGSVDSLCKGVCILEQGEAGLRERLFRYGGVDGRMDLNIPFLNITQVLQFLALSSCAPATPTISELVGRIREVRTFIILSDISISGNSLSAELDAVNRVVGAFSLDPAGVRVIVSVLCGTANSVRKLSGRASDILIHETIPDVYALRPNSPSGEPMGWSKSQLAELVKWFAETVVDENSLLSRMARSCNTPKSKEWGFGAEGWLIATDENTPNNSLPLLWYGSPVHPYIPPYKRVSSMTYREESLDLGAAYWSIIQKGGWV